MLKIDIDTDNNNVKEAVLWSIFLDLHLCITK